MRFPAVRPLMTPAFALALTACGGHNSGPAVEMSAEDSAGVRIVTYAATPDSAPPFHFSAEPLYRHGSRSGDYLFQYISSFSPRGGRFLPDGSAVISDAENDEVVLLGPDGALAGILARRGEGPGEVISARPLVLSQDSILIHDPGNLRFTLFVDGAYDRTYSARRADNLTMLGADGAGGLLMATESYPASGTGPGWAMGYLVRYRLDAAVPDTAGAYRSHRWSEGRVRNPFEAHGSVAAAGGHFITGRSDMSELTWRRPDGSPAQVLRWNPDPEYPTPEHWEQFVAYYQRSVEMQPGVSAEMAREAALQLQERYRLVPDEPVPLYRAILSDGRGRLWLEEYEPGNRHEAVLRHMVIAADGTWLGTVTAPERFLFLDATGDRVLGMVVDELGVQHVVVYGLVPSAEGVGR
ncbi:MAG: hypothetical protein OXU69_07775 [Gemmatimonadota bacterium]|nr:hypothetical protein [Gemmatimonadota bacterium]MDE2984590.1 hypothetical protein [Gemmatimonadota bacterium]